MYPIGIILYNYLASFSPCFSFFLLFFPCNLHTFPPSLHSQGTQPSICSTIVFQKPAPIMLANMVYPTEHHLPVRPKQKALKAPSKPKSRPAHSQPIDPQELSRRLIVVLVEREAHSERKRRARNEAIKQKQQSSSKTQPKQSIDQTVSIGVDRTKPGLGIGQKPERSPSHEETSHCPDPRNSSKASTQYGDDGHGDKTAYRHIPKVAASQFSETTTVESAYEKGPVHILPRHEMKFDLDGSTASRAARVNDSNAPPCEKNKPLRRAQSMRERHYERDFISKPSLPITYELDTTTYPLASSQKLQNTARSSKPVDDESKGARRISTGRILGRSEPHSVEPFDLAAALLAPEKPEIVGNTNHNRVDWTQSDEPMTANAVAQPYPTQPELRKAESRWKLRGRLGSFGRHSKDDRLPTPPEEIAARDASPKSPISGFFSRFKR